MSSTHAPVSAMAALTTLTKKPGGWIWPVWLIAVAGSFAVLEGRAIRTGEDTLSRATWKTTKAWPPLAVVYGILVGGLAVHFFWTNEGLDVPESK